MLEIFLIILMVLWLVDLVIPSTMRWLVNILLVMAFVVILVRLVRGEALYWP